MELVSIPHRYDNSNQAGFIRPETDVSIPHRYDNRYEFPRGDSVVRGPFQSLIGTIIEELGNLLFLHFEFQSLIGTIIAMIRM